jgi:putative spermidine/putrescine transport system permease protein
LGLLLAPATTVLTILFVWALFLLFRHSFHRYTGLGMERAFTLESYYKFFTDPFFLNVMTTGFKLGGVTTSLCLLIAYPTAYAMSRLRNQALLLTASVVIFSPLLTSIVVRSYGWMLLLANTGVANSALLRLGLVDEPVRMLYNFVGVVVALLHVQLPFAVFPILSVLTQLDPALKEAAADLGANRIATFWRVVFPLSLPGMLSAFQLTFTLGMSTFVTPKLLGGGRVLVLPTMIYENIADLNWPLASVQSMVLLALVLLIMVVSNLIFKRFAWTAGGE